MILNEPYNSWLVKNVGENLDEATRFVTKVQGKIASGNLELTLNLDLTWFVLLQSNDSEPMKLEVAKALLQKPGLLAQFKETPKAPEAKRLIAEFLLSNMIILEGLKTYIDFTQLNAPVDFITHALLIKLTTNPIDTPEIVEQRLKIINLVLDSGFKINPAAPANSRGIAVLKVLLMQIGERRFTQAKRLLSAGFSLFGENDTNNNELAVLLIDNRTNPDCQSIIKDNAAAFKNLKFAVAGSSGSNLADYFYWVKEDIGALEFIRSTCNIDITP